MIAVFVLAVFGAPVALADESRGATVEAQKLVSSAIGYFDEVGAEAAIAGMNSGNGRFEDRDLYVFVIAEDSMVVAQVADSGRVGMDARTIRDAADTAYGSMPVDHATPEGAWVGYLREDPLTDEITPKASWVVRHGGCIFGCGIYLS